MSQEVFEVTIDTLDEKGQGIGYWGDYRVHVRGGLSNGDRVVITPMSLPLPGMAVTVSEAEQGASAQ